MPQEKSKSLTIERLTRERTRLQQILNEIPSANMETPGVVEAWSVKDVLAHLADWEEHFIYWYRTSKLGETVRTPSEEFGWDQIDQFNQQVYEKHRSRSLADVTDYFHHTHEEFMLLVNEIPEAELFKKKLFPWLKNSTLDTWLGHYARHDQWAFKHIKAWLKQTAAAKI